MKTFKDQFEVAKFLRDNGVEGHIDIRMIDDEGTMLGHYKKENFGSTKSWFVSQSPFWTSISKG